MFCDNSNKIQHASKFKYQVETLFRAVNLMDRCLFMSSGSSVNSIPRRLLWLLAVTCTCIAAKIEETQRSRWLFSFLRMHRVCKCFNLWVLKYLVQPMASILKICFRITFKSVRFLRDVLLAVRHCLLLKILLRVNIYYVFKLATGNIFFSSTILMNQKSNWKILVLSYVLYM